MGRVNRFLLISLCLVISIGFVPASAEEQAPSDDLFELDIFDLSNLQITSVSKKKQRLFDAAAAIHVITQEDIRRSGHTSIPELLRLVPGVQVSHLDGNKWSISARGFGGRYGSKLLVLIDGRSVYTPLFAGVYWDVQDTMLEDIDRIEVIRGPGGTLWGANAVNGVINIITKNTKDTQGGLISAGAGNYEEGFGGLRYGGAAGENLHYRVFGKGFSRDNFVDSSNNEVHDGMDMMRGGFRLDWEASDQDSVTVSGETYKGTMQQEFIALPFWPPPACPVPGPCVGQPLLTPAHNDDIRVSGVHVLTNWTRTFSEDSDLSLKFYYDRTEREDGLLEQDLNIYDLEFQHRLPVGERNEVIWGLGYRRVEDNLDVSFNVNFDPADRDDNLFSFFLQDELQIIEDKLVFTLGTKVEHNDYTGWEVQPSGRLRYSPAENHTLWGSVSRAVRVPSRADTDLTISVAAMAPVFPVLPAFMVQIQGNQHLRAETLISYEAGYRVEPIEDVAIDVALFYNDYDHLTTNEPMPSSALPCPPFTNAVTQGVPHCLFGTVRENELEAKAYGAEIYVSWDATENWRLTLGYTYFDANGSVKSHSGDSDIDENIKNMTPSNGVVARSTLDLPMDFEFDATLYYVDNTSDQNGKLADNYTRADFRLGWEPIENLDLSLVVQNAFENQHEEWSGNSSGAATSSVPRSIFGRATFEF